MRKSTLISFSVLVLLILINILCVLYKYQQRLDIYRHPALYGLVQIQKALLHYYEFNKRLPNELSDLLKEEHPLVRGDTLEAPVNDEFGVFSDGNKYYLPFLYDEKLKKTYKDSPPNTIIVASPRFNNKRYVLLLKDVINYHPTQYTVHTDAIILMKEDEFQKQIKIQNWQIPIQSPVGAVEQRVPKKNKK